MHYSCNNDDYENIIEAVKTLLLGMNE